MLGEMLRGLKPTVSKIFFLPKLLSRTIIEAPIEDCNGATQSHPCAHYPRHPDSLGTHSAYAASSFGIMGGGSQERSLYDLCTHL